MATFICKYLDDRRGVLTVELEADNLQSAISQVRLQGKPIKVEEKIISAASKDIVLFQPKKIKTKDISLFCKQMSVMLNSGISLNNAVDIMEQQATSKELKESLRKISTQLKEGNQLSGAMLQQGQMFPELLINMIMAGEQTGKLDEVLEKMSVHYTKEVKINNQIRGAMTYPMILALLIVGAVLVLLYFVVPSFKEIFDSAGSELPFATRIVLGISNWLQSYWYIFFGIIGLLVFLFISYKKTPGGKYQLDLLKLNMPLIKVPMQQIVTSRFTSTLATLTSAGIPLVDALGAAAATTNNSVVIDRIGNVNEGIQKGLHLTEMITNTGLFPPMMLSMVKIGEESGSLETMLTKTSDYYEEELDAAIKRLLSMLEPLMIIIMGIVIGGIVAAIMMPLFGLASAIQGGAQ